MSLEERIALAAFVIADIEAQAQREGKSGPPTFDSVIAACGLEAVTTALRVRALMHLETANELRSLSPAEAVNDPIGPDAE